MAGYFDGEGCITVASGLRCLVTATYPESCLGLKAAFGGRVVRRKTRPGEKVQYQWTAYGKQALTALCTMIPYLHEKKLQARRACYWYLIGRYDARRPTIERLIADEKRTSWDLPEEYGQEVRTLAGPEVVHVEV